MDINFQENICPRGEVDFKIFKNGILYDEIHLNNQILNIGKSLLMNSLVGADLGNKIVGIIGIGDSDTANDVTMLDLQGISNFKKDIDSYTFPNYNEVKINFSIGTSEGNGINVKEFGLFSADNTTIFNRVIWGGSSFVKTVDFTLVGSFLITIT